jgi:hypothetical protein
MSVDRRPHRTAGKPGDRRRIRIGPGPWVPRSVELLKSPAWRVLSLSSHRVLDRLDIELRAHAGTNNGALIVTYKQFEEHGVHHRMLPLAIREIEALGLVEITQRGRGGNAEYRLPHRFRITYQPTDCADATNEWRRITSIQDAEQITRHARMPVRTKNRKQKPASHRNQGHKLPLGPRPQSGCENPKFPGSQSSVKP